MLTAGIGFFAPPFTDWFAVNDVVHYFFYFVLGMSCSRLPVIRENRSMAFAGWFCLVLSTGIFAATKNEAWAKFLISNLMLFAIWMISLNSGRRFQIDRQAVYAQTYPVFILSWPCQLIVEILLERILKQPFYVLMPCMLAAGLTVPLFLIKMTELFEEKTHTRVISLIIGK